MANIIAYNEEARAKLFKGVEALEKAVGSTLGPRGNNAALDMGYEIVVLHDGVKVARAVHLKDPLENAGVRIVRQAANKQVDEVGDGTTVVTILSHAIISECLKIISTGVNAMSLRKGLEAGRDKLLAELDKVALPVTTLEQKKQIAIISAEDKDLGDLVADTVHTVGADGIVTVEESKTVDTYREIQEGMQFQNGYILPHFVTDPIRMESTITDAYILITDKEVSNIQELQSFLEDKLIPVSRNLVVIASDVTNSALGSFVATKMNGQMNILAVKAPHFGQNQKDFLEDIATLTGGVVVSSDAQMRFENLEVGMLGRANRVTATKDATIIVGGKGDKELIKERISSIRAQLDRAEGTDFEIEKLRERIGKLSNGVAVIKVGGHTEVEMKERKERADDAVHATQAAVEGGIIPGGEVMYLQVNKVLDDSDIAQRVLRKALERPFEKLVINAGENAGEIKVRLELAQKGNKTNYGYDVTDGKFKDMVKAGIIDPVLVAKSAIKNAVSVAIQVMTVATVIVPEPVEEKKQ